MFVSNWYNKALVIYDFKIKFVKSLLATSVYNKAL